MECSVAAALQVDTKINCDCERLMDTTQSAATSFTVNQNEMTDWKYLKNKKPEILIPILRKIQKLPIKNSNLFSALFLTDIFHPPQG